MVSQSRGQQYRRAQQISVSVFINKCSQVKMLTVYKIYYSIRIIFFIYNVYKIEIVSCPSRTVHCSLRPGYTVCPSLAPTDVTMGFLHKHSDKSVFWWFYPVDSIPRRQDITLKFNHDFLQKSHIGCNLIFQPFLCSVHQSII